MSIRSCLISFCVLFVACEISELESQVEQIFEEGISTMTAESSESDPARGRGGGVEFETNNVATLWECYFKWALERLEETSTVGSLREKVCAVILK